MYTVVTLPLHQQADIKKIVESPPANVRDKWITRGLARIAQRPVI